MSVTIYYDGDCYFCNNYVSLIKLKNKFGEVKLVSLRDDQNALKLILEKKMNPNTGLVVECNNDWYHGASAFLFLIRANASSGYVSSLYRLLGSHKLIASIIYQFLVIGRYFTLMLQGLGLIKVDESESRKSYLLRFVRISFLLLFLISTFQALLLQQRVFFSIFVSIVFLLLYYNSIKESKLISKIESWFEGKQIIFWVSFISLCFLITNLFEFVSVRRFALFVCVLPLIGSLIDSFWIKSKAYRKSTTFLLFVIIFSAFPGLYLAPFYGGIAGWYEKVDKSKPITVYTYELWNNNGESIVLNHALLEPSTMLGRFKWAFIRKRTQEEYMQFLFENYKRRYPKLLDGNFTHQKIFGVFSYPTHTLSDNNAS